MRLTKFQYSRYKVILEELQRQEKQIVEDVSKAREQGDLSENSQYENAVNSLKKVRNNLSIVSDILEDCEIVEMKPNVIGIGSVFGVKYVITPTGIPEYDNNVTYFEIVDTAEYSINDVDFGTPDNPAELDSHSLFAKVLLGKRVNPESTLYLKYRDADSVERSVEISNLINRIEV